VLVGEPDGVRRIAGFRQRVHEVQGDAGVDGISVDQSAPPFHRLHEVASGLGALRQGFEGLLYLQLEPRALGVDPAFELVRSAGEVEAVQERAAV
jgi:hypothetical protein